MVDICDKLNSALRGDDGEWIKSGHMANATAEDVAGARDEIRRLRARVAKLEHRLEIDEVTNGSGDRVAIPSDERDSIPDGISCRDDTILFLEQRDKVGAKREEDLGRALSAIIDHWRMHGSEHGLNDKIEQAADIFDGIADEAAPCP